MRQCGNRKTEEVNRYFHTSARVLPKRAGDAETATPAAVIASILDSAPPLPPAIIAPAWPIRRPGPAGDETDSRFLPSARSFVLEEFRRVFLGRAANFADHDNGLGRFIGQKHFQDLDEIGALDRIAADTDGRRLTQALGSRLKYGLVSQSAGPRDNADFTGLENIAGHDADFAFAGGHDARAVRSDQPRLRTAKRALDLDHIEHRNTLGDADDERDFGVDRLADRVGCARRRHVNN